MGNQKNVGEGRRYTLRRKESKDYLSPVSKKVVPFPLSGKEKRDVEGGKKKVQGNRTSISPSVQCLAGKILGSR